MNTLFSAVRDRCTIRGSRLLTAAAFLATLGMSGVASAATITFDGLSGGVDAPFSEYTEAGFDVTATSGSWFEAHLYGNPVPSLYLGPINNPTAGTLTVSATDGGLFTFDGFDFSSNNGITDYLIQFMRDGATIGVLSGCFGCFEAQTQFHTYSPVVNPLIDALVIDLDPSGTSFNIDNINVSAQPVEPIPEPGTIFLMGAGAAAMGARLRRRGNPRAAA